MSAQATSNKPTVRRFCNAMNSGDAELITETIDELVEPDVLIRCQQEPNSAPVSGIE
jgi:hypothetical protein